MTLIADREQARRSSQSLEQHRRARARRTDDEYRSIEQRIAASRSRRRHGRRRVCRHGPLPGLRVRVAAAIGEGDLEYPGIERLAQRGGIGEVDVCSTQRQQIASRGIKERAIAGPASAALAAGGPHAMPVPHESQQPLLDRGCVSMR